MKTSIKFSFLTAIIAVAMMSCKDHRFSCIKIAPNFYDVADV